MATTIDDVVDYYGGWLDEIPSQHRLFATAAVEAVEDARRLGPTHSWMMDETVVHVAAGFTMRDPAFDDEREQTQRRAHEQADSAATTPPAEPGDHRQPAFQLTYVELVLNQLHDLLCSEDREEEKKRVIEEYEAGKKTLVATIAAVLAPHFGTGVTPMLAAILAVALTIMGEISLGAWCEMHRSRRQRF